MAGLTLTPEMLEGAYEYLRVSPPFAAWGLPHADHVSFRVMGAKDRYGHFRGRHRACSFQLVSKRVRFNEGPSSTFRSKPETYGFTNE